VTKHCENIAERGIRAALKAMSESGDKTL